MEHSVSTLLAGRRGHFRMESGYHSELWFDLNRLFDHGAKLQPFINDLACQLAAHRPDAICGPMTGGAKLAEMVATKLGVQSFYTERIEDRGATGLFPVRYVVPVAQRDRLRGRRIAIVDDAVSAGSAVKGTHADLLACGAMPVACGALIIFGEAADKFAADRGLALEAVTRMAFGMWKPEDCPLCRAGVPVEKISDVV